MIFQLGIPTTRMQRIRSITLVTLFCATPCVVWAGDADIGELIVFVRPEASEVARTFAASELPKIQALAASLEVPVRVVDVSQGAPAEVGITPLLVYQNHRGRSVYQGRYTTVDRVKNFLRTSRVVPQGADKLERTAVPVWRTGRATVVAPLKVAAVTGTKPKGHDDEQFARDAERAIASGFAKFNQTDSVTLGRSDRQFYMDFNPWVSGDGTLYLSLSVFSQFHCKKPVFFSPGEALSGPWADRAALFAKAARLMEQAVADTMGAAKGGDGFDPVPSKVPVVSWKSLGLALPPAPSGSQTAIARGPLPSTWHLPSRRKSDPTQMTFHFPAPLDGYAGEVTRLDAVLRVDDARSMRSLRGRFEVDPTRVTMGEPDLDDAIRGSVYLDVAKHPKSSFVIESIESEDVALRYGELVQATMVGTFRMKGVSIPLRVRTQFEPVVGEDSAPRFSVRGSFEIRLTPFSIEGPDGPSPADDTLVFDFNLLFHPDR